MAIGIFACNKNRNNTTNTELAKHDAALAQIQKIRANVAQYNSSHKGLKTTNAKGVVGALVADCGGCWCGFRWGAKIGSALGNPVTGSAAGAVLGAVIGSGYYLWQNDAIPYAPNPTPSPYNGYSGTGQECGYVHNNTMVSMFANGSSSGYGGDPHGFFTSSLSAASTSVADAFGISSSLVYTIADTTDTAFVDTFLANCTTMSVSQAERFIAREVSNDANIVTYMTDFLNDINSCDPSDTADMFAFCSSYISAIRS